MASAWGTSWGNSWGDAWGALVAGPALVMRGNGNVIANGDAAASLTDHTDFGSTLLGGPGVSRTFAFENTGTGDLTFSDIDVPPGYTITFNLPGTLLEGASANLTIRLDALVAGTKAGTFVLTVDELADTTQTFAITGIVTEPTTPPPLPPGGGAGLYPAARRRGRR